MCGSKLIRWMFPLISILIMVTQAEASTVKYAITDLGKNITPTAINNHGQVVGYLTGADDHRQAITYYQGRVRYLGTFGGSDSEAKAINDKGHIVGTFTTSAQKHGFALFHYGRVIDLFSEAEMINATGINRYDLIIGEKMSGTEYYYPYRKVVVYDHGIVFDLSKMGEEQGKITPHFNASARGINDLAQAVVFQGLCGSIECDHTNFFNADVFTSFLLFRGSDLNDRGQVVGCGAGGYEICKAALLENGAWAVLAGQQVYHLSNAASINNLGQIVGTGQKLPDYSFHAFIHYKGTGTELKTLLPAYARWALSEATAINDRGQIVGTGLLRGEKHAYLLTPLVQPVEIDVKHNGPDHSVNLKPNSQLSFVLFGSSVFNAATIRPASVKLTASAIGLSGRGDRYLHKIKDINGDGYLDFISIVFIDRVAVPPAGSTQLLTLEAATFHGNRVEGVVKVRQVAQ